MKVKLFLFIAVSFCFASCFDLTETFTLKQNGSGVYEQNLDFSRAMTLFSSIMKQAGDSSSSIMKNQTEKKDTSFSFASIADTSSTLTQEQIAVMRNATAYIHVDEPASQFVVKIDYPFASQKEFAILQSALSKGDAFSFIQSLDKTKAVKGDDKPAFSVGQYNYKLSAEGFSRSVLQQPDSSAFVAKDVKELPEEIKDMLKMHFYTIINLPKPAKSWQGSDVTVSPDKKTIKISKELKLDGKPDKDFNFKIGF
ncbi:hypothetical protein ACI6Q2_02590 [Chitinophagaceae bacterium LWZ2-11]